MMFSRAASLRRLAAPAASSLLRSSPLSTTAKRAPEAAAATVPQQAARDRPLPPQFDPAKVKRPTEIQFQTVGVRPVLEEKSPDNVQDDSWWTDVFANPGDWNDNRIHKQNGTVHPKYPDFKHKRSGQPLWLVSAPGWVQSKLDSLKPFGSSDLTHEDLWKDVIENPTKWWDNRLKKLKPKSPDFTHKDSGDALWLSSSPSWVLEKLPPTQSTTNSEDLWKDVIENPTKWWDNRLNKRKPTSPDFKHKESGDVLWLDTSPKWVLEKLPPAESTTNSEDLWKDVIENPTYWWDSRLNKRKPTSPDFTHKDSGDALWPLWLSSSPKWVLEKLPPAESTTNSEDLWKDVIENPTKWWDSRLNKLKPTSPDFKHKDSGVALWLISSPSWVLEKLPPAGSTANTDSWVKATSLSSGKVATNTENWAEATILS